MMCSIKKYFYDFICKHSSDFNNTWKTLNFTLPQTNKFVLTQVVHVIKFNIEMKISLSLHVSRLV